MVEPRLGAGLHPFQPALFFIMDMYDEATDSTQATPPKEDSGAPTGLLSKDFFMGKEPKPGDICSVKVEKIYDDQVEVSYIPHDGSSDTDQASEGTESGPETDSDMMG